MIGAPNLTPEAQALWLRRAEALLAGTVLLDAKPDSSVWTPGERRIYRYAKAISQRMDKLH